MTERSEFHTFADRLESIDRRLSEVQSSLTSAASRLERLDKGMEMQNGRVGKMETELGEHSRRIGDMQSYVPLRDHLIAEHKDLEQRVVPIERFLQQVTGAWKLIVFMLSILSGAVAAGVSIAIRMWGG